jgi:lysophospholipase L1-like esterase
MALKSRRFRMSAFAFGTAAIVALSMVATSGTTLAATGTVKPVVAGSRYLALGDSISFGYREPTNLPAPDYSNAANFVGWPEDVAAALGLKLANAACPGETSSSLINKKAESNGCESHYDSATGQQAAGGYRTVNPLHVSYTGSQLAYAKNFLKQHPGTRLVSLMIGANDGFLCQKESTDGCQSEFFGLLTKIHNNITTILKGIRGTGYAGQIVLLTYYSMNYTDNTLTGEIAVLNNNIIQAAKPYHVRIASGFNAFQAATQQNGGDTCQAQLLTVLTNGDSACGVHPSVQGQALLAQTVMAKIKK